MSFKIIVLTLALVTLAHGAPQYPEQPSYAPSSLEPYAFQYAVQDSESGNDFSAEESADEKVVSGSYKVALPDGRIQIVTYRVEGDSGFVADVKYEGTASYPDPQPSYTA